MASSVTDRIPKPGKVPPTGFTAESRNVRAGEVLLRCESWIDVIHADRRARTCAICWKQNEAVSACTNCHFAYYCAKSCQKKDWKKHHKFECSMLKAALEYHNTQIWSDPDCLASGPLPYLFLKAVRLYSEKPDVHDKQSLKVRSYLARPIEKHRFDIFVPTLDNLSDKLRLLIGHCSMLLDHVLNACGSTLLGGLSDGECESLIRNLVIAREDITLGLRGAKDIVGSGIYLEPHQFTAACRGNSDWLFDGKQMVVKALENLPKLESISQITIAPAFFRAQLSFRQERMNLYSRLATRALGQDAPKWPCHCTYCTDKFEAESLAIKCITPSCMEPIPCDDRALRPCPGCLARNGNRFLEVKDTLRMLSSLVLGETTAQITGPPPPGKMSRRKMEKFFKQSVVGPGTTRARIRDTVVDSPLFEDLHPSNILKMCYLSQTVRRQFADWTEVTWNAFWENRPPLSSLSKHSRLFKGIPEDDHFVGLIADYDWFKELHDTIRKRYSDTDPHYGYFLKAFARCGLALWDMKLPVQDRQGLDLSGEVGQNMKRCAELQQQGEAIVQNFLNISG